MEEKITPPEPQKKGIPWGNIFIAILGSGVIISFIGYIFLLLDQGLTVTSQVIYQNIKIESYYFLASSIILFIVLSIYKLHVSAVVAKSKNEIKWTRLYFGIIVVIIILLIYPLGMGIVYIPKYQIIPKLFPSHTPTITPTQTNTSSSLYIGTPSVQIPIISPNATPEVEIIPTNTPKPSIYSKAVDRYYWYINTAKNKYGVDEAWNLLAFSMQDSERYINDIDNFREYWFGTDTKEGYQILYTIYDCAVIGEKDIIDVVYTAYYRREGAEFQSIVPGYEDKYQRIYLDSRIKIYAINETITGTTDCQFAIDRTMKELIPNELP